MPRVKQQSMSVASLRDFGGGWNVADAEYNLSSRFLTVADNVDIGIDNALGPRPGYQLEYEFRDGVVSAPIDITTGFTTNTAGWILISIPNHGFVYGNHITISGIVLPINGVPIDEINRTHGVLVVDLDTIRIQTRTNPTSSSTSPRNFTYYKDTHTLAGRIIEAAYFQNYIIAMDDNGEIARVHQYTGVKAQLWTLGLAFGTAGNPRGWGPTKHYSFDTWRQTLIIVNGRTNDKPIEIDNNRPLPTAPTQYLVDPATSSNAFVYAADYVLTHGEYLLLVGANNPNTPSTNTPTLVEISAEGTSGVFTGNPAPDDACQIDLGKITTTVDPRITGVGSIREQVFISFYDTAMLGILGVYEGAVHKPNFKDNMPQHGSLNHRVVKNIGNDLFVCDYAGVPAFAQSALSGNIVPERLSQLIDPAIVRHFARLSEDTLRYEAWALFNTRDKQYMLFAPKFDASSAFVSNDGIYCLSDLSPFSVVLVNAINHTVSAGDYVIVSGATDIPGLPATSINGERQVVGVVDANSFLMTVGTVPSLNGVNGGGTTNYAPVNDEHIGYIYQYNPALKIKRWFRYRDLKFDCGCLSKDGTVFFFRDGKVFSWGTSDRSYTADAIEEWDYTWSTGVDYVVGDRVKTTSGAVDTYICIADYTSSGNFTSNVIENQVNWELYKGLPIHWLAETPWSDYGKRMYKKINKYIQLDTSGTAKFAISAFVDNIYRPQAAQDYGPQEITDYDTSVVSTLFVGNDAGGFGAAYQAYGLGLRTREQFNYEYPFECRLVKLRFTGTTTEPLRIIGVSLLYQLGSIYR